MATSAPSNPLCRPGERLVAGKPSIFDLRLLNEHCAREAVLSAPHDLSGLSFDELSALSTKAHRIAPRPSVTEDLQVIRWTPALYDKASHIIAAACARPEHRAVYGGAAVVSHVEAA